MTLLVRHMRPADAEDIAAIFSDETVITNTSQIPHRDAAFWLDFYKSRDPQSVALVCEVEGKAVGQLGIITNQQPRRKHVASFGISVHPDFQGCGVGHALMTEMLNMTDNWMNLMRVELMVASTNERAIHLYKKHGFVIEGEARFNLFTAGHYTSGLHMARMHPRFEAMLSL